MTLFLKEHFLFFFLFIFFFRKAILLGRKFLLVVRKVILFVRDCYTRVIQARLMRIYTGKSCAYFMI